MKSKKSDNLNDKVAKKLTAFRQTLGLSQRQFALKAGIKPNHLNKIENCVMSLSFNNLQKISETYKVPAKEFFDFDEKGLSDSIEQQAVLILVRGIKEKWKLKIVSSLLWEFHSSNKDEG